MRPINHVIICCAAAALDRSAGKWFGTTKHEWSINYELTHWHCFSLCWAPTVGNKGSQSETCIKNSMLLIPPNSWSWANKPPASFVPTQTLVLEGMFSRMHTCNCWQTTNERHTNDSPCIKKSISWINLSMTQVFVEYFPVSGVCWNWITTWRPASFIYPNDSVHFMHKCSHPSRLMTHGEYGAAFQLIWHLKQRHFYQTDRSNKRRHSELKLRWNRILKWQSLLILYANYALQC